MSFSTIVHRRYLLAQLDRRVCAFVVLMTMAAALGASVEQPVSLAIDLPNTAVTLGEPVVLTLTLDNDSDSAVDIDLGWSQEGRLRFELGKPDGTVESARPTQSNRPAPAGNGTVPPSLSVRRETILDEYLHFDRVGEYTLVVRFDGIVRPRGEAPAPDVQRERTFQITVADRDPARLLALCEHYLALAVSVSPEAIDATRRLIFVRDPVAVPFVQRLVTTDGTYRPPEAWEAFVRIGSPEARRSLEELAASQNPTYASMARQMLTRFPGSR